MVRTYDTSGLRMNSRRTQEAAKQQEATRARQLLQNGVSAPTTEAGQEALGRIRESSLTPAPSETLKAAQGNASLTSTSDKVAQEDMGVIERSARQRLADNGITGEEADRRFEESKTAARETMSNTGLGVEYDQQGKLVPGSGRLGLNQPKDPGAEARAKQKEDELAATKGYVKQTRTDDKGNTWEEYVEDPNATEIERNKVRDRQAAQDAAMAKNAADRNAMNEKMKMLPTMEGFLAGIPKEYQDQAQAVFGPLFDYLQTAEGLNEEKFGMGMAAQEEIDRATSEYLKKQKDQSDMLFSYFSQLNKDSLERKLETAEQTYEAEQRAAEFERERTQTLYERGIREQMIKNEENRKSQLLGLGVSGGWRASRQTADVISQLSKGDRILADMYTDASMAEKESRINMQRVSAEYHKNVSDAYDAYDAANSGLFSTMMDRAGEIDKTIYNSSVDKANNIKDLVGRYLDQFGTIAGEFAKTVGDYNKYAIDSYADAQKAKTDMDSKLWDQTMKYIDTYGTQNSTELRRRESALGLPPGSLSSQKTIEELKMKKASGDGIYSDAKGVRADIDEKRAQYKAIYPYAGPEEIDNMVYQDFANQYGDDKTGRSVMRDIYGYMSSEPIDGATYRIYNTSPGSAATSKVMEDIQMKLSDREMAATQGAGALYKYLTDELPEKDRFTEAEAIQYIEGMGYVHTPNVFKSRASEFSAK